MSGKTTLATQLLNSDTFRRDAKTGEKRPCIILDPNLDKRWPVAPDVFLTHNREQFLQVVRDPENYGSIVVVDESGESIGRYGGDMTWLATRGRHFGHQCIFITQRASQIDVNVRTQCANMFVFIQGQSDANILAAEKGKRRLKDAPDLKKGQYLAAIGTNEVLFKKVF